MFVLGENLIAYILSINKYNRLSYSSSKLKLMDYKM